MEIGKIKEFRSKKILVIGDVMVDRYIYGKINRISPEAPVPIVEVEDEKLLPGGAANVMHNLVALGAHVFGVGVVGSDDNGRWLLRQLKHLGIAVNAIIEDESRPTTTKTRIIVDHNHILRFDHELTSEISKHLAAKLAENLDRISTDGIIISDYDKGIMTSELIGSVIKLAKKHGVPLLVDPKLRHHMEYRNVDIMKTNINNALIVTGLSASEPDIDRKLCTSLQKTLQCRSIVITKGKEGMCVANGKKLSRFPSTAKDVFDVTGAGDVVSAVLALSYASGFDMEDAARLSTIAAGIKVGKLGTYAVTQNDIVEAIKSQDGFI